MDFDFFVLTIVFTLVFIQIALGILLFRIYRLMDNKKSSDRPDNSSPAGSAGGALPIVSPGDMELITGRKNIQESMKALCEKYYLGSITLASRDGLVIASSLDEPTERAAQYSYLYFRGMEPQNPMVRLFGLNYNGEEIAGIVQITQNMSDEWLDAVEREAIDILTWWL